MFYDTEDTLFWMNDCWEEDVHVLCCYEVLYYLLVLKLIINIDKGGLKFDNYNFEDAQIHRQFF